MSPLSPTQGRLELCGLDRVLEDIRKERQRTVVIECHTRAGDDRKNVDAPGRLAFAAMVYAYSAGVTVAHQKPIDPVLNNIARDFWQLPLSDLKPKDARRDLVRAAQFIVAEIERIDRDVERLPGFVDDEREKATECLRAASGVAADARVHFDVPIEECGGDVELQALSAVMHVLKQAFGNLHGDPMRSLHHEEKQSIAAYLARRFGAVP